MSGHLSAHQLERKALGILDGASARAAEEHLGSCKECQEKVAALLQEQAGFNMQHDPNVFARRVLARVERESPQSASRFNWTWLVGLLAPAVAMATVVLIRGPLRQDDAYLGVKGGARLEVFTKAGELSDNAVVHPGDELRFGVSAPKSGYALVLGLNEKGDLFAYYPLQASGSVQQSATQQVVLPGSVVLDDTLGHERFYFLLTEHPVTVSQVEAAVKAGHVSWKEPTLPIHGAQSSLVLDKVAK